MCVCYLDGDEIRFGASTRVYMFINPGVEKEEREKTSKSSESASAPDDEEELMKQLPMSFGTKQKASAKNAVAEARQKVWRFRRVLRYFYRNFH